jgi:Tfp pilus assembly protein PilF
MQPNNPHAYFGRAFAFKALKNYSGSSEDFEKAKFLDPLNPKLIVNYKQVYNVRYIKLCNPGEE